MDSVATRSRIHVIDLDHRRRAQINRDLLGREFHTEIYEDTAEFLGALPHGGAVLINEEASNGALEDFFDTIKERDLYYPVTVYAEAPSVEQVAQAMRFGAIDYLRWPFSSTMLDLTLKLFMEVGERQARIEHEKADARRKVRTLTQRETDVLVSLLKGHSNKTAAAELGISHRTVELYRRNVMLKLDAKSASEAARIAIYADLWEA